MTKQIADLIDDISFNFNEDDSIILKTYIQQLESSIKTCDGCQHEANQTFYCTTCERLARHDYYEVKRY